jgi:hypothetical protein
MELIAVGAGDDEAVGWAGDRDDAPVMQAVVVRT